MSQSTYLTFTTRAARLLALGLCTAALLGCDNQRGTSPTAPPTAAPSAPASRGATTQDGTDINAAVPMDEAARDPATTWPAGGAPAAATAPARAENAPADPTGPASGERQTVGGLSFQVPAGWTMKEGGPMRLATLSDGQIDIAITSFPGDVGGKLPNVNRWRQQAGLPPIQESELADQTRTIEIDGKQVMLVDATGPETRLLAASIPGDGRLYFVKLMGPAEQVADRRDAFESFVKSIEVE